MIYCKLVKPYVEAENAACSRRVLHSSKSILNRQLRFLQNSELEVEPLFDVEAEWYFLHVSCVILVRLLLRFDQVKGDVPKTVEAHK